MRGRRSDFFGLTESGAAGMRGGSSDGLASGFRFGLCSLARAWRVPRLRRTAHQTVDLILRTVVATLLGVGAVEFRIDFVRISHELLAFALPPTSRKRPSGLISTPVVSSAGAARRYRKPLPRPRSSSCR